MTQQKTNLASMRRRAFAAGLDHLLVTLATSTLLQLFPSATAPQMVLVQLAFLLLYFFGWTLLFSATPGKWLCKLRVQEKESGERVSPGRTFLREVPGRAVCMFLNPLGYITAHLKKSPGQTLADLLAGTIVVKIQTPKHSRERKGGF